MSCQQICQSSGGDIIMSCQEICQSSGGDIIMSCQEIYQSSGGDIIMSCQEICQSSGGDIIMRGLGLISIISLASSAFAPLSALALKITSTMSFSSASLSFP